MLLKNKTVPAIPRQINLIKNDPTISSSPKILVNLILVIVSTFKLFPNKFTSKHIELMSLWKRMLSLQLSKIRKY